MKIPFVKCLMLQVWNFKERDLKSRLEIGSSVVKIVYHRVNGNSHLFMIHSLVLSARWTLMARFPCG